MYSYYFFEENMNFNLRFCMSFYIALDITEYIIQLESNWGLCMFEDKII